VKLVRLRKLSNYQREKLFMAEERKTNRGTDANRDPITGTPGAHPVGTGVGAAVGGAAAGAAVGSVAGPVGTVAGIIGGAVIGGLAGKGIAENIDPTREDAYWRENHASQDYAGNRSYDEYSDAYRTGYTGYDRYGRKGQTFEESEANLRSDYEKTSTASKLGWTDARAAAFAAWHRVYRNSKPLVGYEVQDVSNTKVGTVNNLWVNDSGTPTFLGVKTTWIVGETHVVPVQNATVNDESKVVRLPFTEAKIKEAPTFDTDAELSDGDEREIYSYYGVSAPTADGTQPRFEADSGVRREQATQPYEPKERSRR
jgi:hypothetical protein